MADARILLDASAFLALILEEPGADTVAAVLDGAVIGAVNLVEAMEVAIRRGVPRSRAAAWTAELGMPVLPFDAACAAEAAALLAAFRREGLSLGDCACLGTARALSLPVLTADRAWAGLDLGVAARLIR
ncbi:MAG: type II toxin-antitoxin system VapC family toxin [Acetobacteraceae bacterium]|nr:type II toxin-antitoxin system VapC family toxin [Acetobacteraceae bacterium]